MFALVPYVSLFRTELYSSENVCLIVVMYTSYYLIHLLTPGTSPDEASNVFRTTLPMNVCFIQQVQCPVDIPVASWAEF